MTRRNENRQGYKKTKVGWIPEKWECIKLKDLSKLGPQNGLYKKQDAYDKDGCRMVHMPQLFANDIIEDQDMPKVLLNESEKIKYLIEEGDLLFGRRSLAIEGSGKCSLVGKLTTPITFESSIIRISLDNRKLYPKYSYFYIASPYGRYQMFTITRVVAVSGIAGSDLKLYQIPLPPLPEQKKIAEILSAWDRAIEQVGRLIDAKKQLKKGLMQKLLTGRIRFSEFGKPVDKKGQLPEGWREVKLGELGKIHSGGTPDTKKTDYWNGDIPWLTPSEVTILKSRFISDTLKKITEKGLKNSSASLLPEKSILVCTRATVGDCAINIVPMTTNQGFKNIELSSGYDADFVYYSICSIKKRFKRFSAGSTFFEVPMRDFIKIRLEIPPLLEQTRIAAVLSACDREIELLKKKKERLQEQKKGLMQKLLTGEIRVK